MKLDNKRDNFIDFLKGVGIFLVILGHHQNSINGWIYSFHMPLFFLLAGVFHKNEEKYFDFFKKKIKIFFFIILQYFLVRSTLRKGKVKSSLSIRRYKNKL